MLDRSAEEITIALNHLDFLKLIIKILEGEGDENLRLNQS
jgi:hypothetical protein